MSKTCSRAEGYRIAVPSGWGGLLLQVEERTKCAACGKYLWRGEHVTRHHIDGVDGSSALFCRDCYPFRYKSHYQQTYRDAHREPIVVTTEQYWSKVEEYPA